jgi:hypothetical protein
MPANAAGSGRRGGMIRACHRFRVLFALMFDSIIGLSPDMAGSGLFPDAPDYTATN